MNPPYSMEHLAENVCGLYQKNPEHARERIETYLKEKLHEYDFQDQINTLNDLVCTFEVPKTGTPGPVDIRLLIMVCSQLLGKELAQDNPDPEELLRKLSDSLNQVFDSLNHLISVINTTLAGRQPPDETIRQVIGYHLEENGSGASLENHIGQIQKAFIATHEAFQTTTENAVRQIIQELGPETIKQEATTGKLNPMKKLHYFNTYETKFNQFITWFESGRFMESYLREFERQCRDFAFQEVDTG